MPSSPGAAAVAKAVGATAATTLVIAAIIFYIYHRFVIARCRREGGYEESQKLGGNVKGVLVNENGLDVLYLRKLEGVGTGHVNTSTFPRVMSNPSFEEHEEVKRVDAGPPERLKNPPHEIADKQVINLPQPQPPPPPPPPPPPNKTGSLKPPPVPKWKANMKNKTATSVEDKSSFGEMKLKPLHWDKLIANGDHSMVWDEINDGSLRFDDELIEALFGYSKNRNSPEGFNNLTGSGSGLTNPNSAQIFLLEPRKSQNTTIVLKSVAVSRKEILDALMDGQGLSTETLEKLTKISPTKEEEAKILQFNGNPARLADAESFLYYILKAVPSAFTCFQAMLFRVNYDPEILHLKETLQTLELGCKELRTRGLFLKLLEAILKAGNRMNAGTSRGNAQGFNLSALRKLSDVKSTDGKSTLLHFVVEQVVRSEGRRSVINKNYHSNTVDPHPDGMMTQQERDREYLTQGLPAICNLSKEFLNVRKAAATEYESFINMCSALSGRVEEIRKLVVGCGGGNKERWGGFGREMRGFLEECSEELRVVREEQGRVMELVRRTTEYYQAGASKDKGTHPLHMFGIVKDFLDMVDKVCADISGKLHKNNVVRTKVVGMSPPVSPTMRTPLMNFRSHFMAGTPRAASSDSEDDF